jgi:hypothetical protein
MYASIVSTQPLVQEDQTGGGRETRDVTRGGVGGRTEGRGGTGGTGEEEEVATTFQQFRERSGIRRCTLNTALMEP